MVSSISATQTASTSASTSVSTSVLTSVSTPVSTPVSTSASTCVYAVAGTRRRLVQDVHTYIIQDQGYTKCLEHNSVPLADDPLRHFGRVWPDALTAGWTLRLVYLGEPPIYLVQPPISQSVHTRSVSGRSARGTSAVSACSTETPSPNTLPHDSLTRLNYGGIIIHVPSTLWLKYP